MPEEPVDTAIGPSPVYLVEVRSIGGLSGSPVFLLSGAERLMPDGRVVVQHDHKVWLLGVVHGHFDEVWDTAFGRERLNEGITMVTPADLLPGLLHREEFMERRVLVPLTDVENATLDVADAESTFSKSDFATALEKATRIKPPSEYGQEG
jgi:hypothetical protein